MNRREQLRSEAGLGLVEVMVTAVVVVLVATATVSSIGFSQKQSARTLARGITANLAEQDQERMKAMRTSDLVGYTATRTVQQENVSYTVDSNTQFVQGPGGDDVSCTSTGAQTSYLRLSTTVTPQASVDADPLTIRSFHSLPVAQFSPTSGTLIVKVFKADGVTGQPGISVRTGGPEVRTATTNEAGCAIFQFLRPGSYTAQVNTPNFVDNTLANPVTLSATVSPAQIAQTTPLLYDLSGALETTFDGLTTTNARGITFSNTGIPSPASRTQASRTRSGLFPFTGPYVVYSGTCAANDPGVHEPTFYASRPSFSRALVTPSATVIVNTHEPVINSAITVRRSNSNQVYGTPRFYLRQTDVGCDATPWIGEFDLATGDLMGSPRYPYGNYWLCAEVNKTAGANPQGVYSAVDTAVPNTTFNPTPEQAIQIDLGNTNTTTSRRTCASR